MGSEKRKKTVAKLIIRIKDSLQMSTNYIVDLPFSSVLSSSSHHFKPKHIYFKPTIVFFFD